MVDFTDPKGQFSGTIELTVIDSGRAVELYKITDFQDNGLGYKITELRSAFHVASAYSGLDVDFLLDSLGDLAPNQASFPDTDYSSVRFNFSQPLRANNTSREMFVVANADLVTEELGVWGAGVTVMAPFGAMTEVSFPTYLTFIPEPSTGFMLLLAMISIYLRRNVVVW